MRRFWFVLSLVLVFVFAASASYIFMAVHDGLPDDAEPYEEPYKAAGEITPRVQRIEAEDELLVKETYTRCGHTEQSHISGDSDFLALSYDQLTAEGWDVAECGERLLELSREYDDLCPTDAGRRLICMTERGVAVYQGTAAHRGNMLLEMPVEFSELPPELMTALQADGYQMESQEELNELLESLDELTSRGQTGE